VVELKIEKGIVVYDDAIASIRTSGLIGDRYVRIEPGGAGDILKPGGRIAETTSPIDIEDLISKYAFGDIKKGRKKETQ
jgi:phospholipid/cholesterol/gamma-HCH transport system substrate-binding protein